MYRVTPSDEELTGDFYFKPEYRDIEIANHHVFGQYFYMSSNPIPTYTVSGTVTDLESGLPLKGITVMLTQMYIEYTKTDENGYYEFTDLPDISSASLRYNVEPLTQNAPVEFEPLRRTVWDINDADNQDFTMQPADD